MAGGGELWARGVIALKLPLDAVVITVQTTLDLLASSATGLPIQVTFVVN